MRKIIIILALLFVALFTFAPTAGAAAPGNQYEGKNQSLCHATGQDDKFVSLTDIPVEAILQNNGHAYHQDGRDIIPAFEYYEKIDGEWVEKSFAGQGDQSLLAFENCQKPAEDVPVAKPTPVFNDPCVTKNDTFSVAPGEGYTVGNVVKNGLVWSITVTLKDGFKWADGSKDPLVFTHEFTNIDCDLPETGGAEYNYLAGYVALAGLGVLGGAMLLSNRRRKTNV